MAAGMAYVAYQCRRNHVKIVICPGNGVAGALSAVAWQLCNVANIIHILVFLTMPFLIVSSTIPTWCWYVWWWLEGWYCDPRYDKLTIYRVLFDSDTITIYSWCSTFILSYSFFIVHSHCISDSATYLAWYLFYSLMTWSVRENYITVIKSVTGMRYYSETLAFWKYRRLLKHSRKVTCSDLNYDTDCGYNVWGWNPLTAAERSSGCVSIFKCGLRGPSYS